MYFVADSNRNHIYSLWLSINSTESWINSSKNWSGSTWKYLYFSTNRSKSIRHYLHLWRN